MSTNKDTILLLGFGSPKSLRYNDIRRFLNTLFKSKEMYIPQPLRFIISAVRSFFLLKKYRVLWNNKTKKMRQIADLEKIQGALQKRVNNPVTLAFLFGPQTIQKAVEKTSSLTVIPLFPLATPLSEAMKKEVKKYAREKKITFIKSFYDHPLFLKALASFGFHTKEYDAILFSFHGMPLSTVAQKCPNYEKECRFIQKEVSRLLGLDRKKTYLAYQSKFGYGKWTEPSLKDLQDKLYAEGKRKFLIFSPSFIGENLETLYEIKKMGNNKDIRWDLVPNVAASPICIDLLQTLSKDAETCKE